MNGAGRSAGMEGTEMEDNTKLSFTMELDNVYDGVWLETDDATYYIDGTTHMASLFRLILKDRN